MPKGVPRGYAVDHESPDEFSVRCVDCGLLKLHGSRAGAHSHADNHGLACAPTAVKPLTRESERPQPGDIATLTYESIRSKNTIDVGGPILNVDAFDGEDLETETACEIVVEDDKGDRIVLARFDPAGGQTLDAYSVTEGQNTFLGELVDIDVKPVATDGGISYTDLRAFKRDILLAIQTLERNADRPPKGVEIRSMLQEEYSSEINYSRIYQNLDALVDKGLVEKGKLDERTNTYATTNTAQSLLTDRVRRMNRLLDVAPEVEA